MDPLWRIKRSILDGRVEFSQKAEDEMDRDGLSHMEVLEAIMGAPVIRKRMRSQSPRREGKREMLYVIVGVTFMGRAIYTKGALRRVAGQEIFYVLISAKQAL